MSAIVAGIFDMRQSLWAVAAASALSACPAMVRAQDRPITDREPDAVDVVKTPVTDLNLSRTEVPAVLVEAQTRPYSLVNLESCQQLTGAVEELNSVLGPDLDLPQNERARLSKGRIAQWAVGTFIPFRSLIREVSGANRQEREIRAAVQAGMARRGFLKGVGVARKCPYPASPATESVVIERTAASRRDEQTPAPADERDATAIGDRRPQASPAPVRQAPVFTSQPVIQPTQ